MNKIGAKITKQNIVIAHRVGRFEVGESRPIIVKFVSTSTNVKRFTREENFEVLD